MAPAFTYPPAYPTTRWVRAKDGIIAGVCAGIARHLNVEPWMVRFFWVLAVLFCGTGLLAYIFLAISLPREDRIPEAYGRMVLGVCSRISRRTDIEIGFVRLGTLILACFTLGAVVIAYIALYFLMPDPAQAESQLKS